MAAGMAGYEDVLSFWFGSVQDNGTAEEGISARWWKKSDAFDAECRDRFLTDLELALAGKLDDWTQTPEGRTALIVLMDQFSRNIFRGTPRSFGSDAQALAQSKLAVAAGEQNKVPTCYGYFMLMPFMHSEDIADQERCIELFQQLADRTPEGPARKSLEAAVGYGVKHRDIVKRFGRFPHRNAVLGRESTPEETEFLTKPGSSF